MADHRNPYQSGLGRTRALVALVAVLAVVGVAGLVWMVLGGEDDGPELADGSSAGVDDTTATTTAPPAACGEDDGTVTVWVAPEVEGAVTRIADGVEDCGPYEVEAVPSYQAFAELSEGAQAPDVWIPDSTIWADAVQELDLGAEPGAVVATSPVVLAAPGSLADELGDEPGWAELMELPGQPLLAGDPLQDPASLTMMLTANGRLAEEGEEGTQMRDALLVSLAQRVLEGEPLETAAEGEPVLVPTTEQALAELGGDADLTVLAPEGGAGVLAYPFVGLGEGSPSVDALSAALVDTASESVWREAGLRAGADGEGPGVEGVPAQVEDAPVADAAQVQEFLDTWLILRPNSRMLVVVDVSGSMDQEVGQEGQSRFDLTMSALSTALEDMAPRNEIGLWWFSTDRGPDGEDWVEALPLRGLEADDGGATHRERLLELTRSLDEEHTGGDTALHDSLYAAYLELQADHDASFRNSIVLMTDGINDDPDGGLGEAELIAALQDAQDDERPVDVVIIGMGPDIQAAPMERIADSVGGTFRQVEEATDIEPVLVSIIANRQGG
ncbi:substrate-binding domain-containing protein [Ornithinimicrobium sediminis]|uniref:substrate-binding domain-containing protein n=1 Tax=Ornithinimicrobium sediminis TaxID=2904603 RepID=UPI001E29671B|nr:substrate-binding domain-containing protein [Ornithinimicrobium sediminis]MCE0486759.1 substrate-binding and VWA domain-containing protein [Ornithinimicrobium sediminis]